MKTKGAKVGRYRIAVFRPYDGRPDPATIKKFLDQLPSGPDREAMEFFHGLALAGEKLTAGLTSSAGGNTKELLWVSNEMLRKF